MDTYQIENIRVIINLPRSSGKTNYLIIRSSITGFPMVVRDRDLKKEVLERAKEIHADIPEPITFREFKEDLHLGKNIKGLLFDDYGRYTRQYGRPMDSFGPPIVEAMM